MKFFFLFFFSFQLNQLASAIPKSEETSIQTFLQTWVSAQNQAEIKINNELYNDNFQGTWIDTQKTLSFDQKGWFSFQTQIKNRGARFGIQNADIEVTKIKDPTSLEGMYQTAFPFILRTDMKILKGEKKITLEKKGTSWSITKEDTKITEEEPLISPTQKFYMPVFDSSIYPILSRYGDASWGKGPITVETKKRAPYFLYTQKVDKRMLPLSIKAWLGKGVRLFHQTKFQCTTKIIGFRLVFQTNKQDQEQKPNIAHVASHFVPMTIDSFYGNNIIVKQRDGEALWLVAELEPNPACKQGTWAQLDIFPSPTFFSGKPAPAQMRKQIWEQVRKRPPYQEIQKRFETSTTDLLGPAWDTEAEKEVSVFSTAQPDTFYLSVFVQNGSACGNDFFGQSLSFWKVTRKKTEFEFQFYAESTSLAESPQAVMDINGDGVVELLFSDKIVSLSQGQLDTIDYIPAPFICPC